MSNPITISRKSYTSIEEEFIRCSVRLIEENEISIAEFARTVGPLIGRTKRGLEQKMAFIRKELYGDNEQTDEILSDTTIDIDEDMPIRNEMPITTEVPIRNEISITDDVPIRSEVSTTNVESSDIPQQRYNRLGTPIQMIKSTTRPEIHHFTQEDIGKNIKVTVVNVKPFGAFCRSEDGKTGLLLKGMITNEFVDEIHEFLQPGDTFVAKVIPDREDQTKTVLNARIIGNIIRIKDRPYANS
jgi:hypothetical protein